MSHFNRWWSKQRIKDKEAKRFSHTVWNEAAKPYQVTIDKLTAELAEVREEAKVWQDRYRKRGYVMDEHTKALERAEVAEAELARYKQGVEVDGLVAYENYPWPIYILDTALEKFHHECVRVLVMKVEG